MIVFRDNDHFEYIWRRIVVLGSIEFISFYNFKMSFPFSPPKITAVLT